MDNVVSDRLPSEATLIVDDRLAALQLEAFVLRGRDGRDREAWTTPDIRTQAAWAGAAWSEQADAGRLPLSAAQSAALWRRVVASGNDGGALIHTAQLAAWAGEAWRALLDWRVDVRALRAREADAGFAGFLRWAARFEALLRDNGWVDGAELNTLLGAAGAALGPPRRPLVWVDPLAITPSLEALISGAAAAGCDAALWRPAPIEGLQRSVALTDSREELRVAVAWARDKLAERPDSRIALVLPREDDAELVLERCGAGAADAGAYLTGRPADREPTIGAALDVLTLFGRHAEFRSLSRVLRSAFLGEAVEDRAARSLAEAALREDIAAPGSFTAAFRFGGLKPRLAARVPELAGVVDARLERLERLPRVQSASRWARFAQETLSAFGWPGSSASVAARAGETWDRILAEFASLSTVLGTIDLDRALAELGAVAARVQRTSPVPLAGITLLERPEQLGLGYDAAWIAGMTDRAWPRPARPNPLLPTSLQATHRMPFATPAEALSRCRAITARLAARVPELIFSYPSVENDYAAAPSPLLRDVGPLDPGSLRRPAPAYTPGQRRRPMDTLDDVAPPLSGAAIPGGAGTLAAQARCPLRALLESRLGARPLERVRRGISPRQRGLLTHRALELLLTDCPGRRGLAAYSDAELEARIRDAVDRTFAERMRAGDAASRAYARLERRRVAELAAALVARDRARGDFEIEGLEVKHRVMIAGLEVACRIDRVDRLADGRLAIIDYKTGQRTTPADWLRPRLLEPQLPMYLYALGADVGAMLFASLQPGAVCYKGICDVPKAFTDRMQSLPRGIDWDAQRRRWAEQLEALAGEFGAGDSRILVAGSDEVTGSYAPLSRVYEQLARFRRSAAEGV